MVPPVDEPVPDLSLAPPVALGPLPPLSCRQRSSSVPISPTHSVGVAPAGLPLVALSPAVVLGVELPPDDALPDGLLAPGVSPGAVPPVELPTAPELAPVAPPPELPLLLLELSLLAPALLPEAPPAAPEPALPCAHDAVAKPTKAAVTAALITFTIMMDASRFGWKGLPGIPRKNNALAPGRGAFFGVKSAA